MHGCTTIVLYDSMFLTISIWFWYLQFMLDYFLLKKTGFGIEIHVFNTSSACDCLLTAILLLIILIYTFHAANVSAGDIASLIYLWNPWAIVTCVGSCTSPIENLMVVIMIYGACSRKSNSILWFLFCNMETVTQILTFHFVLISI